MNKLKMHTLNMANENYKKLAALFPNAVTEAIDPETGEVVRAIDKDVLMQEISGRVVEGREERYQFTWPDKKKAMLAANAPIAATLRPVREDSVGRDGTPGGWDSENLYIEGDNLDVLKLLQETYLRKVKMIYIDPPYNTGNDFVYEDDFVEDADEYLARSGQFDDQGNRLEQNTENNGRFHTDWLNMMYQRLKLAKALLSDDGVIFISIDDSEQGNLKKICDEILSAGNFINTVIWEKRYSPQNAVQWFSENHDFVLVYAKNKDLWHPQLLERTEEMNARYTNRDNDPRGPWKAENSTAQGGHGTKSQFYVLKAPNGKEHHLPSGRCWLYTEKVMAEMIADNRIWFGEDGNNVPAIKRFLTEVKQGIACQTIWKYEEVGHSQDGKKELKRLFPEGIPFDTAKPVSLLKRMIKLSSEPDFTVLDFFSGSATTAHAVTQLNAEDGGHRKFIMVQLPEKTDESSEAFRAGYPNICEIGKERIRRAGRKIKDEAGLTAQNLDIGFRVLRLDSSNMQDVYYNPAAMTQDLLSVTTDNIKPDRTPEDLLFQVMLDLGVELSSPIAIRNVECGMRNKDDAPQNAIPNSAFRIPHSTYTYYDVADGFLIACFDKGITSEVVTEIAKRQPYYAVFRDSSMADDSTATNFDQIFETYSHNTVRKVL